MGIDNVRGPVAPKDPTKKRPFFYIMKNKDVCGLPQPDGTGVQFIYESDGRLASSARLVGNVTDEEMLGQLFYAEGFRKVVHSIGVSVQKDGEPVDVEFFLQMYGKTDPYVSGTTLSMTLPSDGMEMVTELGLCEWSDDDNVTGQIRFRFPEAGMQAKVTVALYLNDGYEAPEQTLDNDIDFESEEYKAIIKKSLLQKGNIHRLKKAIAKARSGEKTTIGFIGGSITQGAGAIPINTECYAYKTFKGFCELTGRGLEDNVQYIKAGVGGTPSELGMLRYEKDVLEDGKYTPDIMVIEFAVNDEGDETKGQCYDSLARKIYNGPGKPAVILLYSVFANDWNLEERLCCVGEAYNLPMVSTRASVVEQFYKKKEDGGVISKNQFFYDMFHPTNAGHDIMAGGLINLLKVADESEDMADMFIDDIKAPHSSYFENVYLTDSRNIDECKAVKSYSIGGFTEKNYELQYVERDMNLNGSPEFPDNWHHAGAAGESFKLQVECKGLLLAYLDSASIKFGTAEVYVDGEKTLTVDPHVVGWTHANAYIALRSEEKAVHNVEVKMAAGDEEKMFTILGFGIVE